MSWFADLAGKAESLLNNLDEQTGAALRNHNVSRKSNVPEFVVGHAAETVWAPKKRIMTRNKKAMPIPASRKSSPTSHHQPRTIMRDNADSSKNGSIKSKISPSRKASPHRQFNLEQQCPRTLVGDVKDNDLFENYGLKHRSKYTHTLFSFNHLNTYIYVTSYLRTVLPSLLGSFWL